MSRAGFCASGSSARRGPLHHGLLIIVTTWLVLLGGLTQAAVGRFVNFESPHVRPLALSEDGRYLFAVNTPDNRISVFDADSLRRIVEVPVGLEPVGVAVRPGGGELWVVNHLSDTVDVVDTERWLVVRTIEVGDEPASLAFTPDGRKAYVTLSRPDELAVVDAASGRVQRRIELSTPPWLNGQDPRAVIVGPRGRFAFVTPFESGNRTRGETPLSVDQPGSIVRDDALDDVDLFVIRTADDSVARRIEGLGTLLSNLRMGPDGTHVFIVGRDARNLVRTVEQLDGHPTINLLSVVDSSTWQPVRRVDLDGPVYQRAHAVAQPVDLEFDQRGRLWVAAQGNDEVVILDTDGTQLGRLAVGSAPRGLVFDSRRERLYVFNRLSHDVSVIDTRGDRVLETLEIGYDPTPPQVSAGREFLYTAGPSGDGSQACVACHPDGHYDNLVWDVGDVLDPKGPMFTQSLRGLRDNAPYHWRGERESLLDFNRAFEDLFRGQMLSEEDNAKLAAYLETIDYGPNPNRNRDGSLRSALAECGRQLFMGQRPDACPPPADGEERARFPCLPCHSLPHGSNHAIIPRQALGTHDDMKVPQLRGAFDKAGFGHDGRHRSIAELLSTSPPFPDFPEVDKQALETFVMEFATAEAPAAVGLERTLTQDSCLESGELPDDLSETVALMENQASLGRVDLTVAGEVRGRGRVHLLYDPEQHRYLLDRLRPQAYSPEFLRSLPCDGKATLTLTAWPAGTGIRAVDRDEDGLLNGYERNVLGTDPGDPDSDDDGLMDGAELERGTDPTRADSDGDGVADGREVADGTDPLDAGSSLRFVAMRRGLDDGSVELVWSTVFGRRYVLRAFDGERPPADGNGYVELYRSPLPETESPEGTESFTDAGAGTLPAGQARFYVVEALPAGD